MERYGHRSHEDVQRDVSAAAAGDPAAVERLSRRGRAGAVKANAVKAEKKAKAVADAEDAAIIDSAMREREEEQRLADLAKIETVSPEGDVLPPEPEQ